MDIGALSIGSNQAGLSQAVSIKLLSMAKSQIETNGANLVQMMQQSVQPHLGGKFGYPGITSEDAGRPKRSLFGVFFLLKSG